MHDDLLEQARHLATRDAGRPRQANLRRSVSAAYYAAFHFLIDQSCRNVMGALHAQREYRQVLGRAFSHSSIKNACESFAGGTLKASVRKGLPGNFAIPAQVQQISTAFIELQYARHQADYDLTHRFERKDVLALINQVETAIEAFRQLTATDEKAFFLACLWAWNALVTR